MLLDWENKSSEFLKGNCYLFHLRILNYLLFLIYILRHHKVYEPHNLMLYS